MWSPRTFLEHHSTHDGVSRSGSTTGGVYADKNNRTLELFVVVPLLRVKLQPSHGGMVKHRFLESLRILVLQLQRKRSLVSLHEDHGLAKLLSTRFPGWLCTVHAVHRHAIPPAIGADGHHLVDTEFTTRSDGLHQSTVLRAGTLWPRADEEEDVAFHHHQRYDGLLHDRGMDVTTLFGDDGLKSIRSLTSKTLEEGDVSESFEKKSISIHY